jgi:hypothetical protein
VSGLTACEQSFEVALSDALQFSRLRYLREALLALPANEVEDQEVEALPTAHLLQAVAGLELEPSVLAVASWPYGPRLQEAPPWGLINFRVKSLSAKSIFQN